MSRRRLPPALIAALVLGLPLLVLGVAAWTGSYEYVLGVALPVVGAILVAVGVSRLLTWKLTVPLVLLVGVLGVIFTQRNEAAMIARFHARRMAAATSDVCHGGPVAGTPNSTKLRIVKAYRGPMGDEAVTWRDDNTWPDDLVPALVLCLDDEYEEVQRGDFRSSDGTVQTIGTYRVFTVATLRRVPTGDVVQTGRFRGSEPPPLPSTVVQGGGRSTKLTGDRVLYSAILKDFESPATGSLSE